ncbi:MAG: class I SAM-dependent rRNA methyltransferase [bacterium]|nr:class I SAM-dependent rRNA methyltransferase [bacterium]
MELAGTIYLRPQRAKPFWCGHPLVYSGAVGRLEGRAEAGDFVRVCDHEGREIGVGAFNPYSDYRVRLLRWSSEGGGEEDVEALVARRVREARTLRAALGLPSGECSVYRLLNSEGDRCSGLTVDWYGSVEEVEKSVAVVVSSAFWVERYRAVISGVLERELQPARICWRQSRGPLEQDGWKECREGEGGGERIVVSEHGVRYVVEAGGGQKTGFYCDQRENRLIVRRLARGRRVLDGYCYTGAFALNAAIGGAASVVGIDTSETAVTIARANAALNGLSAVRFERADVRRYLMQEGTYDMIILDPPKLAAKEEQVAKALRVYRELCAGALRRLSRGGWLVVCSCAAAIGREELRRALREASVEEKRWVCVVMETHAAPDHPVLPAFPEGEYLTCLVCAVM